MGHNQFLLLLWKNFLLQKRKPISTVFEVILPIAFAFILIGVRQVVDVENFTEPTTWDRFSVDAFREDLRPPLDGNSSQWQLAYAPETPVTMAIMQKAAQLVNASVDGMGFPSEEEMVDYIGTEEVATLSILGGIVFNGMETDDVLPDKVSFTIRLRSEQQFGRGSTLRFYVASDWYTSFLFPVYPGLGPREKGDMDGGAPGYFREGFLSIQRALNLAVIGLQGNSTNGNSMPPLFLQRSPYPPYLMDSFLYVLEDNFAFIILLSFIVTAPNIVKDLVLEKERKLRETMKMMGLKLYLNWIAWFLKYLLFSLISVITMTILFHVSIGSGAIINFSDASLTFVFLLLYTIATIMFCFMVSSFISKANTGAAVGVVLFLLSYFPFAILRIPGRWENLTVADKMAASLLSNTAMSLGCVQIAGFETTGVGMKWSTVNEPLNSNDDFTMAHVLIMLAVDSVLYGVITWYLDAVIPGEYGLPQPFYFPFTKSYWCGASASSSSSFTDVTDYGDKAHLFENSTQTDIGVKIQELTKVFKKSGVKHVAVNKLSLDIYTGQITALLGHNGAGKTTTISMLTGFIPPTSGSARVAGYDIHTDMEGVRESLGVCPQHNVLFDTLTVEEHLKFFAKLKGSEAGDIDKEVSEMIALLHLENKTTCQARALSGGMKRKLCVGIALIAGSKLVILDEPTSGMDPEARRQAWDVLQGQREGRTMILTTHFMDEADFLGDRIAIMANGNVQCCGSSLFLKNKYGVGYHMVIVKAPHCDTDAITHLVQNHVPGAALDSNISAELSYVLPSESSHNFEPLFEYIEVNKDRLGILSFGASVTTLEEVFLKVGAQMDDSLEGKLQQKRPRSPKNKVAASTTTTPDKHANGASNGYSNQAYSEVEEQRDTQSGLSTQMSVKPAFGIQFEKNSGLSLYLQQFVALFWKRALHSWRNVLVTVVQCFVPVLFALIPCLILYTLPGPRDPPKLELDLSGITEPQSPYSIWAEPGADSTLLSGLAESYKHSLQGNATVTFVNEVEGYGNDPNMTEYLVEQAEDLYQYRQSHMTAATFEGNPSYTGIVGWFNNEGYHSPAQVLNILGNTLLHYFVAEEKSIHCSNHPLPRATSVEIEEELNTSIPLALFISFNVVFGMCFLVATFVLFLIKERVSKAKHIQFVSGAHFLNYWLATFLWDFINYMIPCLLLLALFAAFDVEGYYKGVQTGNMLVIFMTFGWGVLPLVYLWSFLFDVPAGGYVWGVVALILSGTITNMVTGFLLYSSVVDIGVAVGTPLDWIFTITLPPYGLCSAMQDLYLNYERAKSCGPLNVDSFCEAIELLPNTTHPCCLDNCGVNCAVYQSSGLAWEYPGVGRRVFFMFLQGVVFFGWIFLVDSGLLRRLLAPCYEDEDLVKESDMEMGDLSLDDDVLTEKRRVANGNTQQDVLTLNELSKIYNGTFIAVDGLSVGIPNGECFGLLGVNGAGKTSTFKMLTGDETVSYGDAHVAGASITQQIKQVHQNLGYCPQFDALIDQMTVRESLVMYAHLRGVQKLYISDLVDNIMSQLLLEDFSNKPAGTLSGGNKRKLSTAMSLVGEPPIVFLDEPTTGMDPVARRLLWDALSRFRASGHTLVLTSHSMEECEALCTRLAIMVNGQFKCLGSTQHLKNKFGEGYTLIAKIRDRDDIDVQEKTDDLKRFVEKTFPGSILKDGHYGYVHYQISNESVSWSQLFGSVEKAREVYCIEDYSVSQTTLEQVFLNFAKAQQPPSDMVSSSCGVKLGRCCGCGGADKDKTVKGDQLSTDL